MQINIKKIQDSITPQINNIIRAIGSQGRKRILLVAGQKFQEMTKQNFGNSGKYRDSQWPPLSAKYAKKVGRKNATLKKSGDLYNSILLGQPRSNYIEIFTKSPYAAAHTFGSKRTNLPKRNFWPVQFLTPTYSRLLFNAEKDLVTTISRQMTILSSGALPLQSSNIERSQPQYGNIFSAPSQGLS